MKVIDLNDEHKRLYLCCLEEWSDEIIEGVPKKEEWFDKTRGRGLRVKLAVDDGGNVGGMIQYLPIEESFIEGSGLYFINCIWVHGHKQGPGNIQGKGMGRALIEAAEADAKELGAKGMAAWGLAIPVWMKASWFKKHGYSKADRDGMAVLLWKSFERDASPPRWIKRKKKPPTAPGVVTVTSFVNGWCTGQNTTYERAKRAAEELGDRVVFKEFDTSNRDVLNEWGIADGLFIDGKSVNTGPPPSYDKIVKLIKKRLKKL
ncbi:MAG: GNAT family N-acetyltransferase [Deltaproteobacteria bacterium]|uniref:GNAT family N-acetyltransferase n=1 Tax=Candidatus Zymogenus saltonus TaxID=2844893 RepID=A0A9D8PM12_9DELT|nr:GNAT family N-acetyltransferase [Candidatus Zymogenus saltonus]